MDIQGVMEHVLKDIIEQIEIQQIETTIQLNQM